MLPEIKEAFQKLLRVEEPISIAREMKGFSEFIDGNTVWGARDGFPRIGAAYGSGPVWSGESVTEDTSLNHSVVWCCKRLISESVSFIPLNMMRKLNGEKNPAEDHPCYSALHNAPNAEMTTMGFRETITGHIVMGGNGYAQIMRRSGTGVAYEFNLLLPEWVTPQREKTGQKRLAYVVKEGNSAEKTYTVERDKPQDLLHIPGLGHDGIRGYSVLTMARQSIGTALAAERSVAGFYRAGGRLPYNLKLTQKFKDDPTADKFRADWEAVYSQPHKVPILEPWLDYQQTGISAADAQLLETRLFEISDICRWFLMQPHMVGELSHATFSNIEHLALQFVKMTLTAWLTRWEQNLWRCVLTPDEKSGGYFFRHNVNGLLRGDFLTRMQGYASALQNAHLNPNEVRDYEDLNGYEGGDAYHMQVNQATVPGTGAALTQPNPPNASVVKLGTAKKRSHLPN